MARTQTLEVLLDKAIQGYEKVQQQPEVDASSYAEVEKCVRILSSLIGTADKIMTVKLKQMKEMVSRDEGKADSRENLTQNIYGNAAERRRLVQEYNRRILELATKREIGRNSEDS